MTNRDHDELRKLLRTFDRIIVGLLEHNPKVCEKAIRVATDKFLEKKRSLPVNMIACFSSMSRLIHIEAYYIQRRSALLKYTQEMQMLIDLNIPIKLEISTRELLSHYRSTRNKRQEKVLLGLVRSLIRQVDSVKNELQTMVTDAEK
jgi:hypothetical protein